MDENSEHTQNQQNEEQTQNDDQTQNHQEHSKEAEEQTEVYMKTLKKSSVEHPESANNSRPSSARRPHTSRSDNFEAHKTLKRSGTSKSSILSVNPYYLSSVNDLKYVGDQFIVGKINPSLKPPHEVRFEKMYEARLKKLRSSSSGKVNVLNTLSDYKRTRDPKVFDQQTKLFLTNDLKTSGDQFKVGKIDPKQQSVCEILFQKKFASSLKKLHSNPNRPIVPLKFEELKDIHNKLAIPRTASAK